MDRWGQVYFLAALFAAMLSGGLHAQDQRVLTRAEQQDWPAIGLVYHGDFPNGAVCTGTLVAPDLVLTARHCVKATGEGAALHFAAGWREGAAVAIRSAREVVLAQLAEGEVRTLANDLALIVLDEAIPANLVAPMPLLAEGELAENYNFVGYRRDAPGLLTRDDRCTLAGLQGAVLLLACSAVSGNSGGPLLVRRAGAWHLAAVMVARARKARAQSFAVMPGRDLRTHITAP